MLKTQSMEDKLKKIGPLDVVEVKNSDYGPCIVLFHGYGADCFDLTPLSEVVKAPKGANWYFPNGITKVPIGPGFMGRAWFSIDINALEAAMRAGKYRDMSRTQPPGLDKAKVAAYEFLQALGRKPQDIIIGGFSQGAMLATEIALSSTTSYRGLVILSGTLIKSEEWRALAPQHKGMPFFQSHGDSDALLSPDVAKDLEELLTGAGMFGQLEMFRGGHEIPTQVLRNLGEFLKGLS